MQTDEHRDRRRLYPWVGVLTGLVLVVAAAWAADFIPGDVNDDGVFDIGKTTLLLNGVRLFNFLFIRDNGTLTSILPPGKTPGSPSGTVPPPTWVRACDAG